MNGAVYSANLRLKSALFRLSKNLFIDAFFRPPPTMLYPSHGKWHTNCSLRDLQALTIDKLMCR
ncbi:MAG TPA: hypothetical protein DEF45_27070 [Rhodopirellula sp.]|nr:hypothetical protein [Rhodopirellula sp.]